MNAPPLTCPDLGRWRAWLDEARGDATAGSETHLAACPRCAALVSDLRQNAALATALIRPLAPETLPSAAAIELARTRLNAARTGTPRKEKRTMTLAIPFQRWRTAAAGIAAALMLLAVLGTPQGREATAQFLAQFRAERFEPLPLSTAQLQDLEQTFRELDQLGTISGLDRFDASPPRVGTLAEAARIAGFPVKQPDPATLPANVSATPTAIHALPAGQVRFTFDQAKARAYYQSTGRPNVQLPDRFDGASLVVNTPPVVLLEYGRGGGAGLPALVVGQAGALTVDVQGNVTLEEMRDFLLGLPGLSPETARQLRAIQDWQSTVPIPIPVDQVDWQRTTVAGGPGLLLGDKLGLGSVVIWQRDGFIHGVGGLIPAREVQRVADGIR